MAHDHQYSRRKLAWYDRYAVWALEDTPAGGALLWPSLLLLAPAVLLAEATGSLPLSKNLIVVFGVAAVALALLLFVRAMIVKRAEWHHERHVNAFWERKWKAGTIPPKIWLAMAVQLVLLVGATVAIGFVVG